jgi:hypothetical protein
MFFVLCERRQYVHRGHGNTGTYGAYNTGRGALAMLRLPVNAPPPIPALTIGVSEIGITFPPAGIAPTGGGLAGVGAHNSTRHVTYRD